MNGQERRCVDKKEITEEFEEINIDTGELVKGLKKVHREHQC